MKKTFLLLIICLLANRLVAQKVVVSVVIATLQKAQDLSFQNRDSALYCVNEALTAAQNEHNPHLVFLALRAKGIICEDNNQLKEAQQAYKIALDFANAYLTIDDQLTIYTDWAIIHKKLGLYAIAKEYHQLTIEKAEKIKNWEMVEDGYNGLGTMYSKLSDYNQAIQYYLKSIEAAEKWGNQSGVVLTEQNISNIYMLAKNYDMALKNIEKTYQMASKLGDSIRIGAVLKIYGDINTATGNYKEALEKLQKAKSIFAHELDKSRLADSYLSIGDIFFNLKNYSRAERYYDTCETLVQFLPQCSYVGLYHQQGLLYQVQKQDDKAIACFWKSLKATDSLGFKDIAQKNHIALAAIYKEKKLFEKAYGHISEANKLNGLLFQEANQKDMLEAQFKFDVEKRDLQIVAQKKQLGLLIGGLCLLAGSFWFTWRQMRAKQKVSTYTAWIIRELHHRVKNNMQAVASMMRLQGRKTNDPAVSAILLENRLRLEIFSLLHQQLYLNDNIETLDLQPFIESMIAKLRFSYNMEEDSKLTTHLTVGDTALNVEIALSVGLILNELMTNSFKYATPSVLPLEISIEILKNRFHYADNGNTIPVNFDFDKKQGFGIQLITYFAQQIKGKFKFYVADGMHFEIVY